MMIPSIAVAQVPGLPTADTATGTVLAFLWDRPGAGEWATEGRYDADPIEVDTDEPTLDLGGVLRFNLGWNTWAGDSQVVSSSSFDTFRIDADGRYSDLYFSAQYRFYAGYNMLQHGYVGAELEDEALEVQVGVAQVPFGILPYASHNYFFSVLYYVGLEDDYDLGVTTRTRLGPVDVHVAFFSNDEGNYSGSSADSARYSYDLVRVRPGVLSEAGIDEARNLEETNQANTRLALRLEHSETFATEIGASGQVGQTYERATERRSLQWAAAGHIDGSYGWVDVQLQAGHYAIGQDERVVGDPNLVVMGAYDAPYAVASEASFFVGNLAVEVPLEVWLLDSLTVYSDFSAISKRAPGFSDTFHWVNGALVAAGPIYAYMDWAAGQNQPWLGADYASALGRGDPSAPWELRFNVNVGWYF